MGEDINFISMVKFVDEAQESGQVYSLVERGDCSPFHAEKYGTTNEDSAYVLFATLSLSVSDLQRLICRMLV